MSAKHRSRTLCSWALLAALVIVCTARPAAAWPWEQREQPKVDLRHVQEAPHTYRGRTIRFDCRFINRGQLYKRLNTRFNERQFDNFAVWPAKASLWQTAERRAVVPTLYIPVGNRKLIEFMQDLKRYDLLTVVAVVRNDYAGLPWLEVLTMEQNTDPAERLAERTLTHIRHGVTLQDGGKDLLAVEQFDLAIDGGLPSVYRPTVHQHLGECYLALDRIDEAADAYATAIAADPEDAALYIGRARVNLRRGQPDAVVADCEAALALTAEYPIVHAILGEAKAMQGQIAEGLRLCELTAFAPDASPEVKARAEVHKARIYADGQRYTEAVGAYARAIGENTPLAAVAWLRKEIGEFYEARFDETGNVEYLEEAIREYTNARVISRRQDAAGLTMLAEAFFKHAQATSGGYEEALEALQQAETASPGYVPARLLAGRIALLQGDLAEAERIFSAVSREHPNDPEAQLLMARAYEKSGEADKALLTYQRVTEAAPANVDAWVRIADLAETLGQTGLARDAYARLGDLVPDEPLYAFQLGRLSLAVDDYRTAASASRKAVADGPRGERARMNLATALHALGDIRELAWSGGLERV
ncbi:MAG: tetratricopeptide repeat protein, partial [Planctomycetota bacterium]